MALNNPLPPRLTRNAASIYLKEKHGIDRATKTLAKYATTGGGPLFEKAGRTALYKPADLDAWAYSILSGPLRSTSDFQAGARPVNARASKASGSGSELASMLS